MWSSSTLILPYASWLHWPSWCASHLTLISVPGPLHLLFSLENSFPETVMSFILFRSLFMYQKLLLSVVFKMTPSPSPIFCPHYPTLFLFSVLILFYIFNYVTAFLIFLWNVYFMRWEHHSSLCLHSVCNSFGYIIGTQNIIIEWMNKSMNES